MVKKQVNIFDKTIAKRFPDWKGFWAQAKTTLLSTLGATANNKTKFNAYFFTWKVYDYWKYNIYWGYQDQFFNKFYTRIAAAFLELQKRENLYNQLFSKVEAGAQKIVKLKDEEITTPGREVKKGTKKGMLADRRWDSEGKDISQARSININKPISAVDLIAGEYGTENRADWLQTEMETAYGLRTREGDKIKFNPNWATGKGHTHDKTNLSDNETWDRGQTKKIFKREEQPQQAQQIAKIVQSFSLSESSIGSFIIDYFIDLFYNNTIYLPPGAELKWDRIKQGFNYMSRDEIEGEKDEEGKPKKIRTDFDRLSFEQYQALKEQGEAVEDTLDLENLCRKRAEKTKYPLKDNTKQATLMKALNGLITAYTRDLYYPTLKGYDGIMNQITGFKEFKAELRDKTEISQYYKSIRKKPPQTFYCLLGKPGVGKSEISKTLAKAYKRPFNVIGMAGAAHRKILKGMRPTLDGARYGGIVESFVDCKANIFLTKADHEAVLTYLKGKEKKTKNQEEYIKWLETEIKSIDEQEKERGKLTAELATTTGTGKIRTQHGEEIRGDLITIETAILKKAKQDKIDALNGKAYDLPSKGPVILLDEAEKVKEMTVLFIMGQICDRELNYWYEDDFLEYGINLGEAIILLTANYAELVPDFVRSRCKFVNIQLLTYKERLNILQIRRDMIIREYFPAPQFTWENPDAAESAIDTYNKKNSKITPLIVDKGNNTISDYSNSTILLTPEQQRIRDLMSDKYLEACITETFGIREGIMNMVTTFDFLVKAKVRGVLDQLGNSLYMKPGTDEGITGRTREDIDDPDPQKEGSGLINLYFGAVLDGSGDRQPLSLIKKRDVEYRKTKKAEDGKAECVLNLVPNWDGYHKYNKNWIPESQKPKEPAV